MQAMEKEKKMSKNNPELSHYVGRSRRLLALVVVAFMILFAFGTMPATNMVPGKLLSGAEVEALADSIVVVPAATGLGFIFIANLVLSLALSAALIWLIDGMLRAYGRGVIFSPQNAQRVQLIGWVMLAAALLRTSMHVIERFFIAGEMPPIVAVAPAEKSIDLLVWPLPLDLPILFGAITIIVMGQVMRHAARLEEELSHVV